MDAKTLKPGEVYLEQKENGHLRIFYNLTGDYGHWRLASGPMRQDAPGTTEQLQPVWVPGSFEDRVSSTRIDLVGAIEKGLPPLDFLPASEGILVRGKRHLIAAPAKDGKSLAVLCHLVDMVLAGARVVVFDRENGAVTYARRLGDIIAARGLDADQRMLLRKRLAYHEFPRLIADDQDDLPAYCAGQDLVVFDSQRMFLSGLGLKEDASDDYAEFMDLLVDPLFQAGVATLLLDNTGHTDKRRSRGSSSKADLNEVVFSLQKVEEFDLYTTGSVKLRVEKTRFGNMGEWVMRLGGGVYGSWESGSPVRPRPDFLAAVVAVLGEQEQPLGMNRLIEEVRRSGVSIGTAKAKELLAGYIADADCPVVKRDGGIALTARPKVGGLAPGR